MDSLLTLLSTRWGDMLIKLLEVVVAVPLLAAAGLIGWVFVLRHRENRWIAGPGVMLYVYFRNVDWRCERLCRLARSGAVGDAFITSLRLDLIKLSSDLGAMSRLAGQWERRIGRPPFWYPHAGLTLSMLEAIEALQTALLRHTDPLLHILESSEEWPLTNRLKKETDGYLSYFSGGRDRIWGHESDDRPSTKVGALREVRLKQRLDDALGPMKELLARVNFDIGKEPIWPVTEGKEDRNYGGVWYRPAPETGREETPAEFTQST